MSDLVEDEKTRQKIRFMLDAYDRASATLREWLKSELEREPELVFAGEATLRVPRLEIDAGATSVSLVERPVRWLDAGEIERLEEIAHARGLRLRLGVVDGEIVATLTARVEE